MNLTGESSTTARQPCPLLPREEQSVWGPTQMERRPALTAAMPTGAAAMVSTEDAFEARTIGGRPGESAGLRRGLPRTARPTGTTLIIETEIDRLAAAGRAVGPILTRISRAMAAKRPDHGAGMMTGLAMIDDAQLARTAADDTIETGEPGVEAVRPFRIGIATEIAQIETFTDDDSCKGPRVIDISHMYMHMYVYGQGWLAFAQAILRSYDIPWK